jgi:hypothetical protein
VVGSLDLTSVLEEGKQLTGYRLFKLGRRLRLADDQKETEEQAGVCSLVRKQYFVYRKKG